MFLDAQRFFNDRLVDLGQKLGNAYDGIRAPEGFIDLAKPGVGSQFLEEADKYHQQWFNPELTKKNLKPQIAALSRLPKHPIILDVGSGSGNSIIALFDLLPESTILATDISEHILAILKREVEQRDIDTSRLAVSCADLHSIKLVPNTFDLVVGGSILHHLFDPLIALQNISRGLKVGGEAIFMEPLEPGWALTKLAFQTMIADAEVRPGLGEQELAIMKSFAWQWETRKGTDKSAQALKNFDDKWLFARSYLEKIASDAHLSVRIVPHSVPKDLINALTTQVMNNFIGVGKWSLPDWAKAVMARFDNTFSDEQRGDMGAGGLVVFQKTWSKTSRREKDTL
ncbi:methyltransferase domain-containing protein [Rhizobium sp. TH2]|uniref:class I SAM-dependent methyltransferase n=1 Tax=Rhizobium sp. TH2 TaxID=2775403 RepID=UPI0021571AD2|nr:class I SAM-dependent methyltransferase [Rhizobium sp. TH2]UVC08889.1 methyltransferase domain-containing protein [Rhizobium sp. TH2]